MDFQTLQEFCFALTSLEQHSNCFTCNLKTYSRDTNGKDIFEAFILIYILELKHRCHAVNVFQVRRLYWCAYCLSLFSGYICSAKLVPVSQYLGTVLVCLLGVACLRGEAMDFCQAGGQWLILEIKIIKSTWDNADSSKQYFIKNVCGLFFFFLKGFGRWKNSEYLQFITILDETKKNHTPENKVWQPNIIFSLDVG